MQEKQLFGQSDISGTPDLLCAFVADFPLYAEISTVSPVKVDRRRWWWWWCQPFTSDSLRQFVLTNLLLLLQPGYD